jgi:hypothetical protein
MRDYFSTVWLLLKTVFENLYLKDYVRRLMFEVNPIINKLKEIRERADLLRGYL